MVFVTGPLCSGKRTFAQKLGGRQVYDVQDLAADAADLNRLADELADYDVDRKSTRLNSSHTDSSRMPSSA